MSSQSQRIEALERDHQLLLRKYERLEEILRVVGLPIEEWVSPRVAAGLLNVSDSWIRQRIGEAEDRRVSRKQTSLKYGTHYRTKPNCQSQRVDWQVNWRKWNDLLSNPPESLIL
ncbi:MAG: hypothetical protein HC921_10925 [Synechococcaceae cyanobacterium SM2_3_1]|nr:hypothetical protein [Synechococcaceae cyanobacterium SM2_3_1]